MIPICISTVHGKGLAVLMESIKQFGITGATLITSSHMSQKLTAKC